MESKPFSSIIDFAIQNEEDACQFYTDLAAKVKQQAMKAVFEGFAREELGHKAKLQAIKAGKITPNVGKEVIDLKIGDYLVDVQPSPDMDYQQALIVAMKQEKAAYRLYSSLAAKIAYQELRDIFLMLAQEEAKHKLRFEVEYDELMTEN
jgi:rubrerythrin